MHPDHSLVALRAQQHQAGRLQPPPLRRLPLGAGGNGLVILACRQSGWAKHGERQ